jgi:hypothetical protein
MAKYANDDVMDGALDVVAQGNVIVVCSAQPTNRTEAISTYALADIAVTPGDGNGDFTIADGTPNGRQLTVEAQASFAVDVTGTATHIAICDGTRLLYVTTCTSQPLTAGNTVSTPAWKIRIADPS